MALEPTFGYIEHSRMEKIQGRHAHEHEISALKGQRNDISHIVRLQVLVKRIRPEYMTDKPVTIRPISRIKSNLRKFEALEDASSGRLFSKLMKPEIETFFARSGSEGPMFPDQVIPNQLNPEQTKGKLFKKYD